MQEDVVQTSQQLSISRPEFMRVVLLILTDQKQDSQEDTQ
jgi:hypothetical protein